MTMLCGVIGPSRALLGSGPWAGKKDEEMHSDHRAAARMVRKALSGPNAPTGKPVVCMFEVWTHKTDR